jgi:PAS domain S-box-containing protein
MNKNEQLRWPVHALASRAFAEISTMTVLPLLEKVEQPGFFFLELFETADDAVLLSNSEGQVLFANAQTANLFGYSRAELFGRPIELLLAQRFRESCDASNAIHRSATEFQLSGCSKEIFALRKDGREFPAEFSVSLLKADGCSVFVNTIRDVSERQQTQQLLEDAYAKIEQLKQHLEQESVYLREETKLENNHASIVGQSSAIRSVLKQAEKVASTDSAVLICGETGTGKELIARTIHDLSKRRNYPMVKLNCAALPPTLIESELFGREKGAYTDALTKELGRLELANHSTIFLDEISELPLELQVKLLRILQEGEFERLGSSKTLHVDVRMIAATNRDLSAAVKKGTFREDLLYRLNVFTINIPPLRERREDIPALMWHILADLGKRMGKNVARIDASTLKGFQEYTWPGNIRELRNVLERYLILHNGPVFRAKIPAANGSGSRVNHTMEEVERNHIVRVLRSTHGRIRGKHGAAEILAMKPTTLDSRMKKLRIARRP